MSVQDTSSTSLFLNVPVNSSTAGEPDLNPLAHPVVFSLPRRLTPFSAWHEHIPFAMFLVSLLRPHVIVELGTHGGDSYCAFCQAVQELGLDTRCYAVDIWQGDAHSGFYGPEVLNALRAHHDPLYGGFSQLLQSTFAAALDQFADGSVDLLHLDGYHTYEAARADLLPWLPKLSSRGVILLHDINAHERDFGVWRLWDQLAPLYPHFEFYHAHGLGLLAVGAAAARLLEILLNASTEQALLIRKFFFRLGQSVAPNLAAAEQIEPLAQELASQAQTNASLIAQLADKQEQLQSLTAEWSAASQQFEQTRVADHDHIAALQQTLDEQTRHLDALNIRIERLTQRETELRTQLLDAHAALWTRDQELDKLTLAGSPLSQQNAQLEFLTAENENLKRIVSSRDEGIEWLRTQLTAVQAQLNRMQNLPLGQLHRLLSAFRRRVLVLFGVHPSSKNAADKSRNTDH